MNEQQNFLTKLSGPTLGTLRDTFVVIQENSLSLPVEIPFVPDEVSLEVYNEETNNLQINVGNIHYSTDAKNGALYLYFYGAPELFMCTGRFQYNFTLTRENTVKTIVARVEVIPKRPSKEIQLLRTLRTLLSDDSIPGRGQVWSDLELLEYLRYAMGEINATPSITYFPVEHAPGGWGFVISLGAEYHALRALYNREVRDVFSFNDDGLSVDISIRSEKYMQMINHLSGTYTNAKDELKRHYRPSGRAFYSAFTDLSIRSLRPFMVASLLGYNY